MEACHRAGIPVVAVPGASAVAAAASIAGFPVDKFSFFGFVPTSAADKTEFLRTVLRYEVSHKTVVFFEAPDRVRDTLHLLAALDDGSGSGGGTEIAVGREMTKLHEELFRGTLLGACAWISCEDGRRERGEFCILLHRPSSVPPPISLPFANRYGACYI